MKEVKALIFDIGGVLAIGSNLKSVGKHLNTKSVHESVANKIGVSLDQYFDALDSAYARSIEGKISEEELLNILSTNFHLSKKKIRSLFSFEYKRVFKQNKELYQFAFKKKKEGYKIAILSDQWHLSYLPLVPKKYSSRFDLVVLSCLEGMRKPDPKIYRRTLRRLKISPEESLFIDNQKWNILAAEKIKMKTILFKNNKQLFKQLKLMGI
ncbi:HAD family phosphatase [archaeon]|jgi:epoxide hydrolase-like predicted phosphatase|nr:HAD family phosphatase [archaeon]